MTLPEVVSQEEWLVSRKELLAKEKELTRQRDLLNTERRELPMVEVTQEYVFEGPDGKLRLIDLFEGRAQLIVYHFMFHPEWDEGCPSCTAGIDEVARVYFGVGARFGLDRLRNAGAAIVAETPWQKAAVAALIDDLFNYQSVLASRVIAEGNGSRASDPVDQWLAERGRVVERIDQTIAELRSAPAVDLAMLTVASRQLRTLVES